MVAGQATEKAPPPRAVDHLPWPSQMLQVATTPQTPEDTPGARTVPPSTHPQATQGETHRYIHNQSTHTKIHLVTHRDAAGCGNSHSRSEHTQGGNCSLSHTHSEATAPSTAGHTLLPPAPPHIKPAFSSKAPTSAKPQRPLLHEETKTLSHSCQALHALLPRRGRALPPPPPTACGRRWARNPATSRAGASGPGPSRCGRRTCPGLNGRAALCGWGAAAASTGVSGIGLNLGG